MSLALQLSGITKDYPGVRALDAVDLELRPGEVLGLVGENGAGKSTLIKILGGVISHGQFRGDIAIAGSHRRFSSAADGLSAGVAIVHQELSLVPDMTVAENLLLGREPTRRGVLDRMRSIAAARDMLSRVGGGAEAIDPESMVSGLGIGQQQLVEIARALARKASIVVLDEPTAALTDREADRLFELIETGKDCGTSFIYVSHRLEEITRVCDRVAVLRDGRHVATRDVADLGVDDIVALMTGKAVRIDDRSRTRPGDTVLRVEHLTVSAGDRRVLDDVSVRVREGEIVALAGAMGSGRTALLSALFGLARGSMSGRIAVSGKVTQLSSPAQALGHGIALVPEDRKHDGLILDASVADNLTLSSLDARLLDGAHNERRAADQVDALGVKTAGLAAPVSHLSGGNQQKVVLGRCLLTRPKLLLLDEPTRGVDVGARSEIYKLIRSQVAGGVAVLMASSDLPEILSLADRVIVLRQGRIAGELTRESATEQSILNLAVGVKTWN